MAFAKFQGEIAGNHAILFGHFYFDASIGIFLKLSLSWVFSCFFDDNQ